MIKATSSHPCPFMDRIECESDEQTTLVKSQSYTARIRVLHSFERFNQYTMNVFHEFLS